MFYETGTSFLKFGRQGNPKKRVVYLNEEKTHLFWKAPNSSEKPRSMSVSGIKWVRQGNDKTDVMLKN